MALITTYTGQATPLYSMLVVCDPTATTDEADLSRALHDRTDPVFPAGHTRLLIKAAQDVSRITVDLQLWDTAATAVPDGNWDGNRTATVTFPTGRLIVDNVSAGPIDLQPGPRGQLDLPGGGGLHVIRAWHRGRQAATERAHQLFEQDEASEDSSADLDDLAGIEQYCLQIWPA